MRHLVDVVVADDSVEDCVKSVEEFNHLDGFAVGRDGGEAHDVTEVNGHAVKMLRLNYATNFQGLSHRPEARTGA